MDHVIQVKAPEQLLHGQCSKIVLATTVHLYERVFALIDCCVIMSALLNCGGFSPLNNDCVLCL